MADNSKTFDGFAVQPGNPAGDVLIDNDPGAARLKITELRADQSFQDSLLNPRDPRHVMRDRIWRALHVVAARG